MTTVAHLVRADSLAPVIERFPDVSFIELPRRGQLPALPPVDVLLSTAHPVETLPAALALPVGWIHTLGTGVDSFPLDLVGDRLLTCSRGASATAIAEWVMAMLLADVKRLPQRWVDEPPERWNFAELAGLAGTTLGLIGFGSIGQEITRRANAFDMEVRVLRRTSRAAPGAHVVTDRPSLLDRADHVVVAAALTPETTHILDEQAFLAVKPGCHVVNISRGGHIDQDALRHALDNGSVRRASLDVCSPEPLPAGHWLYSHPAVRLSPHVSWFDPTALDRVHEAFAANLERYLAGDTLHGVVDLDAGY